MPDTNDLARFVTLSADLTGFSEFEINGTGHAATYLDLVATRAGAEVCAALLDTHAALRQATGGKGEAFRSAMRHEILSDPRLGPPARSLLKLWYVGVWHGLPGDWHDAHGGAFDDHDCVPQPASYAEGLLWPAIGANPQGAKPFGYGMWARPPRIPRVPAAD